MAVVFPTVKGAGERVGEALGGGLGQGIASGFQALANMKMNQYAQREQMKMQQQMQQENMQYQQDLARQQQQYQQAINQNNNFKTLIAMGYPQEKAQQMANTDPALLKEIVKYDMQQKGNAPLAQLLSSSGFLGGQGEPKGQEITGQPAVSPEQLATLPRHELIQTAQMLGKASQQAKNLEFKKAEAKEKKATAEKVRFNQQYIPQYEELRKKSEGAKESGLALQSMLDLVNKGNLPTPAFVKTAQMLGNSPIGAFVDVNRLLGPDAEQYIKDSTKLFSGARNIFGSRITNYDFQNFLKSIPDIINTDIGKKRIIYGLQKLNDIANTKYEVAQQIKDENDGYLPKNFDTLLEKRSKKTIDQLSKEFLQGEQFTPGKIFKTVSDIKNAPEGTMTRNKKTGQTLIMKDGKWQKMD